jgi:hypothetical protein
MPTPTPRANFPTTARFLPEARTVASRIVTALKDCNRTPSFREFILAERLGHVILFAVLDELKLGAPVSGYADETVIHQISTLTGGRRVVFSNSNGARYAILLSKQAPLPKVIRYPEMETIGRDVFPIGINRFGEINVPADRLLNILIAGASRKGKSNFLSGLAYAALTHGYQLYLADPQENTFAPQVWDSVAAGPVAASKRDFLELLTKVNQEMLRRGQLFKTVTKPDGGLPVQKLSEYNQYAEKPLPRIFLIVDEANTYMDQKGVVDVLAEISRQALKYGIHTILAAHSWREQDVPRSLSAQFATRLSFGVNDDTSAAVVMDSKTWGKQAMNFSLPGRGILRLDGEKVNEFQAYLMPEERMAALLLNQNGSLPTRSPLTDEEIDLVKLALDENRPKDEIGRMSSSDLVSWGLNSNQARKLGQTWEYKGWLAKGSNNARFVTDVLKQVIGLSNGLSV